MTRTTRTGVAARAVGTQCPTHVPHHRTTAVVTMRGRCHGCEAGAPYDRTVASDRSVSRESFPGGIVQTRRMVRRRGGITGIGVACSFLVGGWLLKTLLGGAVGGALSFVAMVAAFPLMPMVGIPAADGAVRTAVAVAASLAVWWVLGQVVAGRVTQRAVAGWREWFREFLVLGSGLWLGAIGSVLLAAFVLGAL